MNTIENKRFDEERALYAQEDTKVVNCRFEGPADGESALKECRNVVIENCFCDLRYPMWHCDKIEIKDTVQTENCRAALWYDTDLIIEGSTLDGIKAVRECAGVTIKNCKINSPEFGWRSKDIKIENTALCSQYAFFECRNIEADGLELTGKYTFQYIENATFRNCHFDTKDAFWHSKNVTVYDKLRHTAKGSGWLEHNHFKDLRYDIAITDARDFLAYDMTERQSPTYYGTIYGTGTAFIKGDPGQNFIDVNMATGDQSKFTFVLSGSEAAGEYDFITFTNTSRQKKESGKEQIDSMVIRNNARMLEKAQMQENSIFNLNLQIEATNLAKMNLTTTKDVLYAIDIYFTMKRLYPDTVFGRKRMKSVWAPIFNDCLPESEVS